MLPIHAWAADTPRTQSYLQTRFANNSTGAIKAQDLRDFLVSTELAASTTKTANYTATANDQIILLDGTSSTVDLTLPAANVNTATAKKYYVKALNVTNQVRVVPSNSQTIDGSTAYVFAASGDAIILGSDGANWQIFSRKTTAPGGILTIGSDLTISNNATELVVLSNTLPANYVAVGTTFRIIASGTFGDTSSAPTTTWNVRWGANNTNSDTQLATLTRTPAGTSRSADFWQVEFLVTVKSIGGSGSAKCHGILLDYMGSAGAWETPVADTNISAPTVATNAASFLGLYFKFGTANASNTITVHNAVIELVKL